MPLKIHKTATLSHVTIQIRFHVPVSRHTHRKSTAKCTLHITTAPIHHHYGRFANQDRPNYFGWNRVRNYQLLHGFQRRRKLSGHGRRNRCHEYIFHDHYWNHHGIFRSHIVRKQGQKDHLVRRRHHRNLEINGPDQLQIGNDGGDVRLQHINSCYMPSWIIYAPSVDWTSWSYFLINAHYSRYWIFLVSSPRELLSLKVRRIVL